MEKKTHAEDTDIQIPEEGVPASGAENRGSKEPQVYTRKELDRVYEDLQHQCDNL